MEVRTEQEDDVLVTIVNGRIDSATVSEFQHLMERAITDDIKRVVVDFENLSYINSAGLRAVLVITKSLWTRKAKLALHSLQPSIQEVFSIAGFDKIIQVCASRAEALDATREE